MFWLLLLPFRLAVVLAFGLLVLPFVLLRVTIKALAALLVLPFVLLLVLACIAFGAAALTFALLLPLLPYAVVAFVVWALLRRTSPPALRGV